MKKIVKMLLLAAIFTLALSVSAFAASGTDAGICDVETYVSGVTVTPKLANGTTNATQNGDRVYVNAERVTVTFSNNVASGKYYLVVALDGEGYPTADNVAYINQTTAGSGSVSFDVYPKALVSGETYNIYVSSNDGVNGYQKVASFGYYAPYQMGDVNLDDAVDAGDALLALQIGAGLYEYTELEWRLANVISSDGVDASDALMILQYGAGLITSWGE